MPLFRARPPRGETDSLTYVVTVVPTRRPFVCVRSHGGDGHGLSVRSDALQDEEKWSGTEENAHRPAACRRGRIQVCVCFQICRYEKREGEAAPRRPERQFEVRGAV